MASEEQGPVEGEAPVEGETPVALCPNCGHENAGEVRYCDACGVALGRMTSPDTHPDEVVDDEITAGGASYTERGQQT